MVSIESQGKPFRPLLNINSIPSSANFKSTSLTRIFGEGEFSHYASLFSNLIFCRLLNEAQCGVPDSVLAAFFAISGDWFSIQSMHAFERRVNNL